MDFRTGIKTDELIDRGKKEWDQKSRTEPWVTQDRGWWGGKAVWAWRAIKEGRWGQFVFYWEAKRGECLVLKGRWEVESGSRNGVKSILRLEHL